MYIVWSYPGCLLCLKCLTKVVSILPVPAHPLNFSNCVACQYKLPVSFTVLQEQNMKQKYCYSNIGNQVLGINNSDKPGL